MPTLGFLKKRRTKESRDSATPASPIADSGSSLTQTSSKGADTSGQTPASSQSSYPHSSDIATSEKEIGPTSVAPDPQMNPALAQKYTSSPHNSPDIKNLINPPQNDGAAQSYPQHMDAQATGGGGTGATPAAAGTSNPVRTTKGKYTLTDFTIQRTLGTGSFGRVHLVQSRHNQRYYAVKVLKKNQVFKMKQVEHTNDERRMLQKVKHPFLITLWGTFQDSKNLYMVMDFVEGGELFSLLRKSQVSQGQFPWYHLPFGPLLITP